MTPAKFAEYIRLQTRTTAATFTDSAILLLTNIHKNTLVARALKSDEDIFLVDAKADLENNVRAYPFPENILTRIKRVEVNFTGGTAAGDWITLDEFDLKHYHRTTDEATILSLFGNSQGNAFYDIYRKQLCIYSGAITHVAQGLKLWVNLYPADLTELTDTVNDLCKDPTTTSHGIPEELQLPLAIEVIKDWKSSREKPIPLSEMELTNENRIKQAIDAMSGGNTDRAYIMEIPPATDRGDNGYNY